METTVGYVIMGLLGLVFLITMCCSDDDNKWIPCSIAILLCLGFSQMCLYTLGSQSIKHVYDKQIVYKIEQTSDSVKVFIRDIPKNDSKGYYYIVKSTDSKIGDTLSFLSK